MKNTVFIVWTHDSPYSIYNSNDSEKNLSHMVASREQIEAVAQMWYGRVSIYQNSWPILKTSIQK